MSHHLVAFTRHLRGITRHLGVASQRLVDITRYPTMPARHPAALTPHLGDFSRHLALPFHVLALSPRWVVTSATDDVDESPARATARRGDVVYTSERDDLGLFGGFFPNVIATLPYKRRLRRRRTSVAKVRTSARVPWLSPASARTTLHAQPPCDGPPGGDGSARAAGGEASLEGPGRIELSVVDASIGWDASGPPSRELIASVPASGAPPS
jgi:hypothetical protein